MHMATPEFRFRARFSVITFGSAAGLALVSEFPSDPYFQWLIRGVVAGLLLLSVWMVLRWWLVRTEPAKPEDVRGKLRTRRKWIKSATWASLSVAYILFLVMRYLLPTNVEALILGFSLGVVFSIALLVGPALWPFIKSKSPERKGRLEPVDSPNQIHIARPPSSPAQS